MDQGIVLNRIEYEACFGLLHSLLFSKTCTIYEKYKIHAKCIILLHTVSIIILYILHINYILYSTYCYHITIKYRKEIPVGKYLKELTYSIFK